MSPRARVAHNGRSTREQPGAGGGGAAVGILIMGLNLISGWFPTVTLVIGLLALGALFLGRGRGWWLRRVAPAVVIALLVAAAAVLFTDHVWHPFADDLPRTAVIWIA